MKYETDGRSSVQFVDLGLPSGVLWAENDVEEPTLVGCALPSYEQAQELIEFCDFYLRESTDGTRYIGAQGPSGQFVYFPLREYEGTPGPSGCCWCRGDASDSEFGYFLLFAVAFIPLAQKRGRIEHTILRPLLYLELPHRANHHVVRLHTLSSVRSQ